jgi:hypothetical protein
MCVLMLRSPVTLTVVVMIHDNRSKEKKKEISQNALNVCDYPASVASICFIHGMASLTFRL